MLRIGQPPACRSKVRTMPDPQLVVYEKNTCSTCGNLFTLLRERGIDYETVEYHVTGLSDAEIRDLLVKLSAGARDILRIREPLVEKLGLQDSERFSDDDLIALMVAHPQLVQRPIVVRGDRAVLARPVERVLELFD